MTKREFEMLAIAGEETISAGLYSMIEDYYMSDNDYHAQNGGIDEDKQAFVNRVFGGAINTPETVLEKIIHEAQKENRYALNGNAYATPEKLAEMDRIIAYHTRLLAHPSHI